MVSNTSAATILLKLGNELDQSITFGGTFFLLLLTFKMLCCLGGVSLCHSRILDLSFFFLVPFSVLLDWHEQHSMHGQHLRKSFSED